MTSFHKNVLKMLLVFFVVAVVTAGCGGGGGGDTTPGGGDTSIVTITGTVKDYDSDAAVVGAVVTIGSKSAATDTNGNYRITYNSVPSVSTWSVNGSNATPAPGYYTYWAKLSIVTTAYNALELPMPSISTGTNTMPIVYLCNKNTIPPF